MQKIAYIDHYFHKKTRSTEFFINLLKKRFNVKIFWSIKNNNSHEIEAKKINQFNPDIIVIFQVELKKCQVNEIKNKKNIIFIPMYDSIRTKNISFWYDYIDYKILCFSKKTYKLLKFMHFDCYYAQYFLPLSTNNEKKKNNKLTGYFWQRRNDITWNNVIKKLIDENQFMKIHIQRNNDPGFHVEKISKEDVKKFNIIFNNSYKNKKEYLHDMKKYDVYFAPRTYEGIGMTILEAMAFGKCIVSPNNPVMNEYIQNKRNGFLYNLNNPKRIDFSNFKKIILNNNQNVIEGYKKWIKQENNIYEFINENEIKKLIIFKIFIKFLLFIIKIFVLLVKAIGKI